MTPDDLAILHARSFTTPPPWSAQAFAALIESPGTFIRGDARGFVMGRALAGEAEVLTLAVAPDFRRKGHARSLMTAFHDAARPAADTAFLEVAEDNNAAIALYLSLGYAEVGRRPRYFEAPHGARIDALVMRLSLAPSA
ncbi:GNAT family N-acetyltransferase (plasmid) [Pseudorhodobacter turbinis]|uniref:GNAT family N-acetyltransferase n=1 Tax=Pseudorhodobacter turbinis TaxID=2500533 RepID=A0A4P8EJ08_9RHOB|nr:N-acetyltransferase [Pseudorhodobacter turbinis]QCO57160.1 GNAT family N-acetyltransferase [Pseudorhodobacter turbinis]